MSRLTSVARRFLSHLGLYPNRLFLVQICPEKLIEFDELIAMADLRPDDTVLDIGCGTGMQTLLLAEKCRHVTGIDLSKTAIERAEALALASLLSGKVKFISGDVVGSEFGSGGFTKIMSFCVLEHIPDWRTVLRKAHDWLSPNGTLVISVDSLETIQDDDIVRKHRKDNFVATYFDKQSLESALREAGFSNIEMHSILKSDFARKLFTRNVASNRFGGRNLPRLLIEYARLRRAERAASDRDKGIFLVARATR